MSEKVVIDTSVMISGLLGKRGASREVIRRCLAGQHLPLISNSLFQEYKAVSFRKRVKEACQALAEFDSEVRFRALASVGKTQKGLDLLDNLDRHFNSK